MNVQPARPIQDRRQRVHRLLRFDLICRVAILFAATITCLLGWFVPASLTARLLVDGQGVGQLVLVLLTTATAVGYMDVVVNDLASDRWHCRWAKHNQHRGYALIAMLYLLQAYASVGDSIGPEDLLPLGYVMNAALAAWYAWTTAIRGWHV